MSWSLPGRIIEIYFTRALEDHPEIITSLVMHAVLVTPILHHMCEQHVFSPECNSKSWLSPLKSKMAQDQIIRETTFFLLLKVSTCSTK